MYLEQLIHYKKNHKNIRPQSPVSPETIRWAEQRLNVLFPQELKGLFGELNGDRWLLLSLEEMVEDTLRIRAALRDGGEESDDMLLIGANGCGDYYAYTIEEGRVLPTEIIRWEHECNQRTVVAHSLQELIDQYYQGNI